MDERPEDKRNRVVDLGIDGIEQAAEIGSGGFSVVFRARQPHFRRDVAIKVLFANLTAEQRVRFDRECEAIGGLSGHPNIVTVYMSGQLRTGQPYIVMEFLSGGSLADRIAQEPLDWISTVDVGIKVAGALEYAHRAGVLHRDVKPENVMVSEFGQCKLGDFGIARVEGHPETAPGKAVASWEHAPPEIVNGQRPTKASDVYSLASTLFTLIDGSPPYHRDGEETLAPLFIRILNEPLRRIHGEVPPAVEQAIRQGLAKDSAQRPQTAAEFGRQLQGIRSQLGLGATMPPLPTPRGAGETRPDNAPPTPNLPESEPSSAGDDELQSRRGRGLGRRRRALIAGAVVAAVVVAIFAIIRPGPDDDTSATPPGNTASSVTSGVTTSTADTSPTGALGAEPTTVDGVRLGTDLRPDGTEPCRSPTVATGAAWQIAPVQLGGRSFDQSYFCNVFAGGTGSLEFVLGTSYRLLRTSIGFSDQSSFTGHQVRFEFIGDDREYLTDPITLRFGEVRDLDVDVTGVTRLRIRITELSQAGGSEGASRPVFADPTLASV